MSDLASLGISLSATGHVKNERRMTEGDAITSFSAFIESCGFAPPTSIMADGRIHRFSTDWRDRRDSAGWYSLHLLDGHAFGVVGDWRTDLMKTWTPAGQDVDDDTRRRIQEAAATAARELADSQAKAREEASQLFSSLPVADDGNGYLARKRVHADGMLRQEDDRLVVPMLDASGISSIQRIWPDGKKRYLPNGRVQGCYYPYPYNQPLDGGKVYVCEGLATAASVHDATGAKTFVAFSAGQLSNCVATLRPLVGGCEIIVVADNDESGRGEAEALKTGCRVVLIPEKGMDANDYANAGGDLKALIMRSLGETPLRDVTAMLVDPKPVRWLIKRWLPRATHNLFVGSPASGKTYLVLDMMLHLACGLETWCGFRCRKAVVVYLCGEGSNEITMRVKAWELGHGITIPPQSFYLTDKVFDLDQPEGYARLASYIEETGVRPDLVTVDTLNRYFSGDENKADQSRLYMNNVNQLTQRFGCAVITVHHTGRAEDARERARGSSAWDGGADSIESCINEGGTLLVTQTKMKPAKKLAMQFGWRFEEVALGPEWNDEDGEPSMDAYLVPVDADEVRQAGERRGTMTAKDREELKAVLSDAAIIHDDADGIWWYKDDWRRKLRDDGRSPDEVKNFFRTSTRDGRKRPYGRMLEGGSLSESGTGTIQRVTLHDAALEAWFRSEERKEARQPETMAAQARKARIDALLARAGRQDDDVPF